MDSLHTPDRTLLKRIGLGDALALRALHARYAKSVYALAMTRLHTPQDAYQVVTDTFARVWHSTAEVDDTRSVVVWLLGIARHSCLALLRERGEDCTEDDPQDTLPTPAFHHDPEPLMVTRTQLRALEQHRHALSGLQQEALHLAVVEGLSLAQVAQVTHATLPTAKARVYHARRTLVQHMRAVPARPHEAAA